MGKHENQENCDKHEHKDHAHRPGHHDAELILELYDLRRETVMRESRNKIFGEFFPKTYQDFSAVTQPGHPLNAAFRQVSSYWEMAYSFARHGIVNPDFMAENCGEGFFLLAKAYPFLEKFRAEGSVTAFRNAEWLATHCEEGKRRFEMIQARVKKMMESK